MRNKERRIMSNNKCKYPWHQWEINWIDEKWDMTSLKCSSCKKIEKIKNIHRKDQMRIYNEVIDMLSIQIENSDKNKE